MKGRGRRSSSGGAGGGNAETQKNNFSAVTQNLSIVLNKYKTITGFLVA